MFSDWLAYFWNQILNPFVVQPMIFNIPWMYIAMQPLRLIGMYPALVVVDIASIYVLVRLCQIYQLGKIQTVLFFLSAPVFWNFFMGQLDGILLSAYLLPPALSTFLFWCKPQTNLAAIWIAWKKSPKWVAGLSFVLVVSAFLVWRWPFSISNPQVITDQSAWWLPPIFSGGWNWSLWPFGLVLIYFIIKDPRELGLLVSPFIFPYTGLQSLIAPILICAKKLPLWLFVLIWLGLWLRWAWMLEFIGG